MDTEILETVLGGLIIAILADIIFGEPSGYVHIAVISGKLSGSLAKRFEKTKRKRAAGTFTLYFTIFIIMIPSILFLYYLNSLNSIYIIFLLIYSVMLKTTFALSSMGKHINPIIKSMKEGDLEKARLYLSLCVRRDTSGLDAPAIASAAIETVAEGITDSFTGALFMYSIFGIIGAGIYRIINTLDSTFGYRDSNYFYFGKASARADTILNYIPAMFTAALIHISSFLLNYNVKAIPARSTFHNFQSRNAALSIGSMAAVLNVKLEKRGKYIVNTAGFEPTFDQIRKSLRIFYLSFFLMVTFVTIPVLLVFTLLVWPHVGIIYSHGLGFLF